jgi:SAM-dependent methyltransferase
LGNKTIGIDLTFEGPRATTILGIPAFVGNMEEGLPFLDNTFEMVTFIEVIEHLLRPDLAISEIHRVLKANGTLVVTTPNYAYWVLRILYALGAPPVGLRPRPYTGLRARQPAEEIEPWLDPHIRFFTPASLTKLLAKSGFRVVSIQSTFVSFPSGLAPFMPWLPGLPLRIIGKVIGNLNFLGDYWPSLLAAGLMAKAIKK